MINSEMSIFMMTTFIGLGFIFVLIHHFQFYAMYKILKEKHPSKWQALGSPGLIWNNSPYKILAILKFISSGEYLKLHSKELDHKVAVVKKIRFVFSLIFAMYIILFFITFGKYL